MIVLWVGYFTDYIHYDLLTLEFLEGRSMYRIFKRWWHEGGNTRIDELVKTCKSCKCHIVVLHYPLTIARWEIEKAIRQFKEVGARVVLLVGNGVNKDWEKSSYGEDLRIPADDLPFDTHEKLLELVK